MSSGKKIWLDGKLIDYDKAQIHVLTHALHYGTAVFEGITNCLSPGEEVNNEDVAKVEIIAQELERVKEEIAGYALTN